ncbi:chemotaxis protein CheW [Persicobacter psychrovividus]|uniref:Chemotaxis protein CheW n=1 Tax=Persicobacter psychrovividus TaxID=387638 RepID=A0ABM7VLK4_9BACT|nr:chemotaxis protein CheW [Persicobacter psychrovividus]
MSQPIVNDPLHGQSTDAMKGNANKQSTRSQLIVFKLGGEEYGLPIDQVKEVVLTPRLAPVPHTPEYILGAANIRGSVIAIMDLEHKFHLSDQIANVKAQEHYSLVIENEKFKVGVLVKEVPNTLSIDSEDIDDSKEVLQFSSLKEECVRGIAKVGDRMIILLDIIAMLQMDDVTLGS